MENKPEEHKPLLPPSALGRRKVISPVSADLQRSSPAIAKRQPAPQEAVPLSAAVPGPVAETTPSSVVTAVVQQAPPSSEMKGALPEEAYASANTVAFMTGSDYQMHQQRKRLPVGVYLIVALNVLGFIGSFFNTSNSTLYIIPALVNVMAAACLLLRMDGARKVVIGLSAFTLVLCIAGFLLLAGLQQRVKQNRANYDAAIAKLEQGRLTPQQKEQIAAMNTEISQNEKLVGKGIRYTYVYFAVTGVISASVVVYLTRPKVKEVFQVPAI